MFEANARCGGHLNVGVKRCEREQRSRNRDFAVKSHGFGPCGKSDKPFGIGKRCRDVCASECFGEFVAGLRNEQDAAPIAGVSLK